MTALHLTGLLRLSPDRYIGRAHSVRAAANSLWLPPLRWSVQSLAAEVSEHMKALRFESPHCPPPPSLPQWGLSVALLLVMRPRLAWKLLTLFYACYSYRLVHYQAIAFGVAIVFGAVMAFAIGRCVWLM